MDLPYYHGTLTKHECETLLLKEGVNGNFLIRDSESIPGALCLCVSKPYKKIWDLKSIAKASGQLVMKSPGEWFNNCVYTYRIFREKHGYYKIENAEGSRKLIFPTLEELVSKFEKPDQGLVVHLSKPIKRPSLGLGQRRSQLALNDLYENSSDYVDVLPGR